MCRFLHTPTVTGVLSVRPGSARRLPIDEAFSGRAKIDYMHAKPKTPAAT